MHILYSILSRVVVFGVLVFIHELGHYLAARWRGIHVEAFSIGFGPALLSWTDRYETVWKLCALPLGGFVKMHGMAVNIANEPQPDEPPLRDGQAFFQKSVASRAIVVAAGPIANFLLAAMLYTALFSVVGRPVPLPVVGDISANSAAAEAGLKTGDTILAIDGHKMADFEDVRRVVMVNAGHRLSLDIARAGQTLTIPVLIKPAARGDMSVGRLGVTSGGVKYVHLWPGAALVAGITETGQMFGQIFGGLVHIVTTGSGVGDLGGPIAVVILSGQVARQGIAALVSFTAFLSINLGLVNLLPIPVLDGGHLMFYAAEAIRGRPLPARALDYGFRVGFALIASLFVFLSINDVVKHTGALHWVAHLLGAAS